MKTWNEIPGWFDARDYAFYEFAVDTMPNPFTFLEIGSFKGRSLNALHEIATAKGKAYTVDVIDTFSGDIHMGKQNTFADFTHNTEHLPIRSIYARDSAVAWKHIPEGTQYDAIFIDGLHTTEAVISDINLYMPFVKDGGLLCGHDYGFFGVADAVRECFDNDFDVMGICWYKTISK